MPGTNWDDRSTSLCRFSPGVRSCYYIIVTLFLLIGGYPERADAHVKWFTATNVHDAPRALSDVLSNTFLAVLGVATLLVIVGFILDGWIARRWPTRLTSGVAHAAIEERLVRIAAGAYFVCMSDTGGVILTPELTSQALWVRVVQFATAFFLAWRPMCFLSGLGVAVLYADAINHYGVFHLIDYVFFPCLAIYLASLSLHSLELRRLREPLLVAGLAFSLAWTAIEKFLYPQWTGAVVMKYPSVGFGLPIPFVTVVAGFVEFTLAFYLVTGRGLLRFGGLAYASIFVAAMPVFGRLDVYGHLIIVSVLSIVVLRGTTPMQNRLHFTGRGVLMDSVWITALYIVSLSLFFVMYYAMQRT